MIEYLIKYKDFIAILSGIGTFISALIAVFTLNEVKKQRLSLYKPEILIKSFLVSISKNPLQKGVDELLNYKVCDYNDYSNNYNQIEFDISPKYKVDNLGLGIAKYIKCEWQFNTVKAIKLINSSLPNQYSFDFHKKLNIYFLNYSKDDSFHYSANANIYNQIIDYIAPINIQKHSHFHAVPEIILFSHYLYLIFKNNLIDNQGDNFNIFEFNDFNFPKPKLKIEYKDLNNKRYKKEFSFKVCAVATQIGEILDLTQEFSYLEFEIE